MAVTIIVFIPVCLILLIYANPDQMRLLNRIIDAIADDG